MEEDKVANPRNGHPWRTNHDIDFTQQNVS